MSVENVEIVRQLLEHWQRGDWRGGRDLVDDDCKVVFPVAKREDCPDLCIDIDTAGPAPTAKPNQCDDLLAHVDDLPNPDLDFLPSLGEVDPSTQCLTPDAVCTRVREPGGAEKIVRYELTDRA